MKIQIAPAILDNKDCIAVRVDGFDATFPATMRQIPGARWIPEQKAWLVPYSKEAYADLKRLFGQENIITIKSGVAGLKSEAQQSETSESAPEKVITLCQHPSKPDYFNLYLPKTMTQQHLATVKNIHGRRWNPELKCWEAPYTKLTLRFLEKYFPPNLLEWAFTPADNIPERLDTPPPERKTQTSVPPARYEEAVTALEQCLLLKRYSWRTIKAYKNCFRQFIRHYDDIKPSQLSRKQINDYIATLIREKHITESYQNQIACAIKMFYSEVVEQSEKVEGLVQAKRPQRIPQVLTENEVARLLRAVDNLKHRCVLMMIYSAGLRLGEVIHLRLNDIQAEHHRIFVRDAKGKKDRCTILAGKTEALLQEYLAIHQPAHWLFEGQEGGQYSERSVQAIFAQAKERSRINPLATVHTSCDTPLPPICSKKGWTCAIFKNFWGTKAAKRPRFTHTSRKKVGTR